ncbi:MAG: hypothetical protein IT369_13610, partial [Candidatus Latescibacteria bacterium]|nr:hypothetical protein [Candidatus Latescibacterota bacterium]
MGPFGPHRPVHRRHPAVQAPLRRRQPLHLRRLSQGLLDPVVLHGLRTRCFGQRVLSFAELGSTNDELRRLADEGAAEGTLVIAELQTAGRGRRGRVWHSPPGTGLWCSLLVRPPATFPLSLMPLLLGTA